ncbi:MAG: hypothetical protein ACLSBB_14400 [Ruthenibacterium lactatiformans]
MWHITLPSIKPTIVVMLIMGVGMLNADSGYDSSTVQPSYL